MILDCESQDQPMTLLTHFVLGRIEQNITGQGTGEDRNFISESKSDSSYKPLIQDTCQQRILSKFSFKSKDGLAEEHSSFYSVKTKLMKKEKEKKNDDSLSKESNERRF